MKVNLRARMCYKWVQMFGDRFIAAATCSAPARDAARLVGKSVRFWAGGQRYSSAVRDWSNRLCTSWRAGQPWTRDTPCSTTSHGSRTLQLWSLVGFWGLGIGIAAVAATIPIKSTQSDATARGRTEGTGDAGVQSVVFLGIQTSTSKDVSSMGQGWRKDERS